MNILRLARELQAFEYLDQEQYEEAIPGVPGSGKVLFVTKIRDVVRTGARHVSVLKTIALTAAEEAAFAASKVDSKSDLAGRMIAEAKRKALRDAEMKAISLVQTEIDEINAILADSSKTADDLRVMTSAK